MGMPCLSVCLSVCIHNFRRDGNFETAFTNAALTDVSLIFGEKLTSKMGVLGHKVTAMRSAVVVKMGQNETWVA